MTSQDQNIIPSGYVRRAHGISGDVVVRGLLQDSEERMVVGAVMITIEDTPRRFEIATVRRHQGDYIISFDGLDSRESADELRGTQFGTPRSELRSLGEGEWWPEDLVGCSVEDLNGEPVGRVTDVITGASQDRLVVTTPEGERGEIPFVAALVPSVDIEAQRVVVELPDGLFE